VLKKIFIVVGLTWSVTLSAKPPSLEFIFKRGLQHCTGYCNSGKIKCQKGVNKQGYYDWCLKNCLHKDKKDRQKFVEGISSCTPPTVTPPVPPPVVKEESSEEIEKRLAQKYTDTENSQDAAYKTADVLLELSRKGEKDPSWEAVKAILFERERAKPGYLNFTMNAGKYAYEGILYGFDE
jgi:hypothetical protein